MSIGSTDQLLRIQELSVSYSAGQGKVIALDSVDIEIGKEEFLAVVGESGCGKTTLGLAIIGLLAANSANVIKGSIDYKGVDLARQNVDELRNYRGSEIALIFQDPLTSLNPLLRVGDQIAEGIVLRNSRSRGSHPRMPNFRFLRVPGRRRRYSKEITGEAKEFLNTVRIPDPEQVFDRYPFELSGGMRQRVMIAMALSQQPSLLIADEPTTALDVTTQAQVLKLMKDIKDKLRTTILLITHDLAVASQVADRVIVMYAGKIVEDSDVYDLFTSPLHPYTKGLISCIPKGTRESAELTPIPGSLPDLSVRAIGCRFAPRCPYAMKICSEREPPLYETRKGHRTACFLYDESRTSS